MREPLYTGGLLLVLLPLLLELLELELDELELDELELDELELDELELEELELEELELEEPPLVPVVVPGLVVVLLAVLLLPPPRPRRLNKPAKLNMVLVMMLPSKALYDSANVTLPWSKLVTARKESSSREQTTPPDQGK
jgi:hypothetical protein